MTSQVHCVCSHDKALLRAVQASFARPVVKMLARTSLVQESYRSADARICWRFQHVFNIAQVYTLHKLLPACTCTVAVLCHTRLQIIAFGLLVTPEGWAWPHQIF